MGGVGVPSFWGAFGGGRASGGGDVTGAVTLSPIKS